ncbi:CLUMA_CG013806, isoform A [Clunio marinus]|uniref:CLUMA_CG013806, isoform A n=1 Tax=Clunio marinus TaxID=568069 RepID=A0A1J1IPW6_9DIPT|nr:CLUMA_CG013806, isoform A [Clunio marinus]
MNSIRKTSQFAPRLSSFIRQMSDSKPTPDSAGAIRAAGGGFAKMEVAHEEEYFYKMRQDQLHQLKEKQMSEHQFREKAIKDHEQAIQRHKEAISGLKTEK